MVDRMMMVQHCLYGTKTLRRGGQARTKDYAQPSLGTDALRPGGKGSAETINSRNTPVATRNIRLRGKPIIQIIQRKRAYAAASAYAASSARLASRQAHGSSDARLRLFTFPLTTCSSTSVSHA